ncbi:hypothetical protein NLG97_g1783 [Lecanicillium saksenae]|uniref:Uncharacterized protein n=1 Tax=Lecanicillium saksenae TaxID=468837 RepID=A0ACC1R5G6_9HYPO|nr:hypothetical protein NLG97_g1783 [Lecanicillium saksenae]
MAEITTSSQARNAVFVSAAASAIAAGTTAQAPGIRALAGRLLGDVKYENQFDFHLTENHEPWSRYNIPPNDNYSVTALDGKIRVEGTTLIALARGLRHYANEALGVDEFWFVNNTGDVPDKLPLPKQKLSGTSTVPWRYNLNTVTFGYTFVWYSWSDWERLLDWAALRGVNIQLAWVGYEKIYLDSFLELGMKENDILDYFSGAAFQPWNRFGNIHGTWGGEGLLSRAWIDQQFALQKKIVARMVELGITPALPGFSGFVPEAMKKLRPDADIGHAPAWALFPENNTQTAFLKPTDPLYADLQRLFIEKQMKEFGNVTNVYTIDQFNEMNPESGDVAELADISVKTYSGITAANPAAIWLMQGWLFYSGQSFWNQDRVEAYLGGPPRRDDMLLLDVFSEYQPQWQRTNSYAGRPWIWCQLHDFGGRQALYGAVSNVTENAVAALAESDSLVGYGLTPEAYEGNEVVYGLLFDQAWETSAIDTKEYFQQWTRLRYKAAPKVPDDIFDAWELLRQNAYDVKDASIPTVGVSIYQMMPVLSGLANRTGAHPPPTALPYDPKTMKTIWQLFYNATIHTPSLLSIPSFHLDFVDITRQLMGNAYINFYTDLVDKFNTSANATVVEQSGKAMLAFLHDIDEVLNTNAHFTLEKWLRDARSWGEATDAVDAMAFNARSQVTAWGIQSPLLNDYASKAWSGLVGGYYAKRWQIFVEALVAAKRQNRALDEAAVQSNIAKFAATWQRRGYRKENCKPAGEIGAQMKKLVEKWPGVFL